MTCIQRASFGAAVIAVAIIASSWAHGALGGELRVFELVVKERRIDVPGATIRVEQGDEVELRITSDEVGELHLHGYDVTIDLQAGQTTVVAVQADVAGRFPISSHGFGASGDHDHGHEALLYLEVYPR